MATLAPSRHCSRACRALQASWSMTTRYQSTSAGAATQESSSTKVASSGSGLMDEGTKHSSSNNNGIRNKIPRISSKRQLTLARAISLYHQTLDFPDFLLHSLDAPANEHNLDLPPIPPRVDNYIEKKLAEPLSPLMVDLGSMKFRAKSRPISPKHDPYSYMDNAKRKTLSLASQRRVQDKAESSKLRKWDALSPLASRESQTRARKMVDALLGTVDACAPGLKMVQTIYEINNGSASQRSSQRSGPISS